MTRGTQDIPVGSPLDDRRPIRRQLWLGAALIFALTLIAYIPAMSDGGFIWDDDSYLTNNHWLQEGWHGLTRMWVPKRTPQYYPVVFTMFWVENQLWDLHPRGYHIVNVVIHALNAVLVWLLARRLKIQWAWLIGAVFALHPVHVESVAWITERKNTLSGLFYLLAALAYLRFDEIARLMGESRRRWPFYAMSLGCFVLALLSKSVTCSLPAALILMMLWQGKRLNLKRLFPLLPFFAIGLLLALNTAHIEKEHVGAFGEDFQFLVADRFLIASRALLFYPLKIIWPWPMMFVYPRWHIDGHDLRQYWSVACVLAVGVAAVIGWLRGWRGPALALAFFAGTIFPALGFVNVYPMMFSFVADHFQYLASLGIIALIVGALAAILKTHQRMILTAVIVLPVLAALTWIASMTYFNAETVWRDTLSKNDAAFMPHNNLASGLLRRAEIAIEQGKRDEAHALVDEAEHHLLRALELRPRYENALTNISDLRRLQGRYEEGLTYAQQALDLIRDDPEVRAVIASGQRRVSTPLSEATWVVGRLQELLGRNEEALASYRDAIAWNPRNASVQAELARFLMRLGREDEAAPEYEALVKLQPDNLNAMMILAGIREHQGQFAAARDWYIRAVNLAEAAPDGNSLPQMTRLIHLLATCPDPKVRDTKQAVSLMERLVQQTNGQDPSVLDVLANVLAEDGRLEDAIKVAQQAAALVDRYQQPDLARQIRGRLEQYRARLNPPTPLVGPTTAPK